MNITLLDAHVMRIYAADVTFCWVLHCSFYFFIVSLYNPPVLLENQINHWFIERVQLCFKLCSFDAYTCIMNSIEVILEAICILVTEWVSEYS